ILPKKTLPDRKKGSKKNWFVVNTQVYAREYRLSRQWTATIITKRHGSLIYDVEVDKDRSHVIDQITIPSRTARTRIKPSHLQVDASSKTYGWFA
ncbi:unnamed protein product, partial [Hymenolepis diminuta]